MIKFFLPALVLSVVAALLVAPDSVTTPLVHFLIVGAIPLTGIEIGFWLPLVLSVVALAVVSKWSGEFSEDFVDYKTKEYLGENQSSAKVKSPVASPEFPELDTEEVDLQRI